MPYGAYRRRGLYRRRYPYYGRRYRWRYRWRARRHRYYSWRHRRPRYRWVRGTRARFTRKKKIQIYKRRRREFLRWLRRYRYKTPKAIRVFNPPHIRTCVIKGHFPLLYFTGKQISWPFVDPLCYTYSGGGISFLDFTLNWLYLENKKLRNKWSTSNYGLDLGRFLKARFTLYRHPWVSYITKYFQGSALSPNQTYMDIHPAVTYLQRKRKIMASNERVPPKKQFKKKRIYIKSPKDMTQNWYKLTDLGEKILVRLGTAVTDFLNPYQTASDNSGNYYHSIGYHTPDRRTLRSYVREYNPINNKYSPRDINTWGKYWATWGGPVNIKLPYGENIDWCGKKFPELLASGVTYTDSITRQGYKQDMWSAFIRSHTPIFTNPAEENTLKNIKEFDKCTEHGEEDGKTYYSYNPQKRTPAFFVDQEAGDRDVSQFKCKFMSQICGCNHSASVITHDPNLARHGVHIRFCKLVAGLPFIDTFQSEEHSFSSHRTGLINPENMWRDLDKTSVTTQGFWPGRYSSAYDTGIGNEVYGLWIPASMNRNTTYDDFAAGSGGPGTASHGEFATERFFQGVPYWLVFYGHSYKSFLRYLNRLKPEIKLKSRYQQGFFAVAIRTWPAEPVQSGPFYQGYAPLRYAGSNAEYFSAAARPRWRLHWQMGTNCPPTDNCGNLDHKCWIFCLLRDGRKVMYGSSFEGSLLSRPWGKDYFCTTAEWTSDDDIAVLGHSGPFLPNPVDKRISDSVVNLFGTYKFWFQFAGFQPPPRNPPEDVRQPCKVDQPVEAILARFRRSVTDNPTEPAHPAEVSRGDFLPWRDATPSTGRIVRDAMERLTTPFPFSPVQPGLHPYGLPTDNKLFCAVSDHLRGTCPTPPGTQTQEEDAGPLLQENPWPEELRALWEQTQTRYETSVLSHTARSKRGPHPPGIEDEIPSRRRRHSQPSGHRHQQLSQRLGVLQPRVRLLRRLLDQQMHLRLLGYNSD
ncbi:ORF1 [torque teno Delphinidae virus 44]